MSIFSAVFFSLVEIVEGCRQGRMTSTHHNTSPHTPSQHFFCNIPSPFLYNTSPQNFCTTFLHITSPQHSFPTLVNNTCWGKKIGHSNWQNCIVCLSFWCSSTRGFKRLCVSMMTERALLTGKRKKAHDVECQGLIVQCQRF